ncbi:hypothetical protein ACFP51_08920 [Streptomyces pratens]|uniref:Uncharacterized protein n=1 Tax=Streptomyces pratens TaxID=887456 RepID=A0ABW1LSU0_9ACTN
MPGPQHLLLLVPLVPTVLSATACRQTDGGTTPFGSASGRAPIKLRTGEAVYW